MNISEVIKSHNVGETVELRSEHEIKIVCGKASITLTPDGKILLQGTKIIKSADSIENFANRVDYW